MKILAIDTATEACSAALYNEGELTSRYQLAPRQHSRLILKMIDSLMQESALLLSSLDALAFGRGPGAFMGIRIATGVTQGIAYAKDLPVIPVSNLMAIAEVAREQTGTQNVLCAIDARMAEVYWAAYQYNDGGEWLSVVDESVSAPQNVVYPQQSGWVGAGSGWASYADALQSTSVEIKTIMPECLPTASAIINIALNEYKQGRLLAAVQAQPVYLRNNVAKKPQQKTYVSHLNLKRQP